MSTNPNSKKIWIVRTESFMDAAQTLAKEFMSMSRKSIGPYWKSINAKAQGSGLDYNEIELLLPHVIDREPTDRDFRTEVAKFYKEIITSIPFGQGRELEVGMLISNKQPMGARLDEDGEPVKTGGRINLPIEIMDYIRYRHAQGHPQVGLSKEATVGNSIKLYYIHDLEVADTVMTATTAAMDKAIISYMEISVNPEKVKEMLILLGTDPRDYAGANADAARSQRLRLYAEKDFANFNKIYSIDNFPLRSKIKALILAGIFSTVGDRIYEHSTKKLLAENMEDAVKVLQSPEFSDNFVMWSGALQDIMAKPTISKNRNKKVTA
jgi:hypothetical protein